LQKKNCHREKNAGEDEGLYRKAANGEKVAGRGAMEVEKPDGSKSSPGGH